MHDGSADRLPGAKLAGVSIDPLIVPDDGRPDHAAVEAVYRSHRRRLVGLAAAVTFDRSVAEEIVHEAFVGLSRRLARPGEPVRDPVAYVQRSVVNLGVQYSRRRTRAGRLPQPPAAVQTMPELAELWPLVVALPAQQRAVVALRFWEDLRHEQIAEVLNIPLGTVKSTLHRALARLKEQL